MSLEQNKATVLQFYKAYDEGNLEKLKETLAPNIIVYLRESIIRGVDDVFEYAQTTRSIFPDGYLTIEDVIAENSKVVIRGTFTGTHCKEWFGVPPTGKQVKFSVIEIARLENSKLVEHWAQNNALAVMQQLNGKNLV